MKPIIRGSDKTNEIVLEFELKKSLGGLKLVVYGPNGDSKDLMNIREDGTFYIYWSAEISGIRTNYNGEWVQSK